MKFATQIWPLLKYLFIMSKLLKFLLIQRGDTAIATQIVKYYWIDPILNKVNIGQIACLILAKLISKYYKKITIPFCSKVALIAIP